MNFIDIKGVTRDYQVGGGMRRGATLRALRGVDLSVKRGEIVALVGESGCGKSTLARLLLGVEAQSSGDIAIGGRSIATYSRLERAQLIQPVFQDPYSSLNPRMTVADTIAAPLEVQGKGTAQSRLAAVHRQMDAVGLARYLAGAYPMQLSGGQRQRVAIARALIGEPTILICDEPTSALDVSVQAQILNLMRDLQDQFGLTYLFISHNLAVVRHMSTRIGVMYLGRIVELGPRPAVFEDPRHPYTRQLLSAVPIADPRQRHPHDDRAWRPIASPIFPLGYTPEPSTYDEVAPGHFLLRGKWPADAPAGAQ